MTVVAGTDPYPWPWDGRVDPRRLALVLCGWETHWAARAVGTPAEVAGAVARAGALAAAVAAVGGLVVTIAHARPARAPAALPDPEPLPAPHDVDAVAVTAAGLDGFHGGPLETVLRAAGRDTLLVAGHGLEGPVHCTLRAANDRGDECLLVVDACTPLTAEAALSAAHSVTMSGGIFGAIGDTAAVLDTLAPLSPAAQP